MCKKPLRLLFALLPVLSLMCKKTLCLIFALLPVLSFMCKKPLRLLFALVPVLHGTKIVKKTIFFRIPGWCMTMLNAN